MIMDIVDYFFKNSNPNFCGYKTCKLLKPGCKGAYNGTRVSLQNKYPYTLNALLNIRDGYQDKFCI